MGRPQDIGKEFEDEFVERRGLKPVPGSGNQWYSKLDASGRGARWSLKATNDASYRVTPSDLLELLSAHAPGQTGETRLMAIKLRATSERPIVVILALEEDFLEVAEGEIMVAEDKTANKRLTAATPELLREAEDGE